MLKMSSSALLILSILIPFSLFISCSSQSQDCGIAVDWGQLRNEGGLINVCATGYYKYVLVSYLRNVGNGQTPVLDLDDHCDPPSGNCTRIGCHIKACQDLGVKILLSISGFNITHPLDSAHSAAYLSDTYLTGSSGGPLGDDVAMDGINFDTGYSNSTPNFINLLMNLRAYSRPRRIYLAITSPNDHYDPRVDSLFRSGSFDYVFVQFYNFMDPTDQTLFNIWNRWNSSLGVTSQLFMGLRTSPPGPYIPPDVLVSQVLPVIRNTSRYGGVMLSQDVDRSYTGAIYPAVCNNNTTTINHQELLMIKQVPYATFE